MKVVFNDVDEFLVELKRDADDPEGCNVQQAIVRITFRKRTDGALPLCSVAVIAAYCNYAGELVELTHQVGTVMQHDPQSERVWANAEDVRKRIASVAAGYGLDVRTGAYQEAH